MNHTRMSVYLATILEKKKENKQTYRFFSSLLEYRFIYLCQSITNPLVSTYQNIVSIIYSGKIALSAFLDG
jgi:hypothetical protein